MLIQRQFSRWMINLTNAIIELLAFSLILEKPVKDQYHTERVPNLKKCLQNVNVVLEKVLIYTSV